MQHHHEGQERDHTVIGAARQNPLAQTCVFAWLLLVAAGSGREMFVSWREAATPMNSLFENLKVR